MRVSIVGTGYVGLVTGVCLAEHGHQVICVDLDGEKVSRINAGHPPIHEEGLPALLQRHAGVRLHATTNLHAAVRESELTFIAVGTPAANGRIDLRYVEQASREIGKILRDKSGFHAIVVKSTVVPGTTTGTVRRHLEAASGKRAGIDFGLGMNPEFLTEGTAVENFLQPDRLVLGAIDERTHAALVTLYEAFDATVPRILTQPSTAEMIKYASNAVLATLISFSNELARICSELGDVDALEVMRGVHQSAYLTSRVHGEQMTAPIAAFLEAGCGFGGSCLPKDVMALVGQAEDLGVATPLLRSVLEINRGQPTEMLRLLRRHYPSLCGLKVTVLGLAFKPGTDDVRESPAFPLLQQLREAGARLSVYDPIATCPGHPDLMDVHVAGTLVDAIADAEAILLVTRWPEFAALPDLVEKRPRPPLVVDGRRMLDPSRFTRYEGIGR